MICEHVDCQAEQPLTAFVFKHDARATTYSNLLTRSCPSTTCGRAGI